MNAVTIRLADLQDLEALCKLYIEFHEFHVRGVPDRLLSLSKADAYDCSDIYSNLKKIINNNDSILLVAQVAHQTVGLAEVYVRQDEPNPARVAHRYGYLQSLMVLETFRRHGVGAQLVEAAQRWAREKDATEMRVETWEFANGPLEFYENIGYRTLRRTLVREL